jgi:hypothetical protein
MAVPGLQTFRNAEAQEIKVNPNAHGTTREQTSYLLMYIWDGFCDNAT